MNPGSIAEKAGLQAGDAVLQINNRPSDELEHEQAKQEIMASGNEVFLVAQRYALALNLQRWNSLNAKNTETRRYSETSRRITDVILQTF